MKKEGIKASAPDVSIILFTWILEENSIFILFSEVDCRVSSDLKETNNIKAECLDFDNLKKNWVNPSNERNAKKKKKGNKITV